MMMTSNGVSDRWQADFVYGIYHTYSVCKPDPLEQLYLHSTIAHHIPATIPFI